MLEEEYGIALTDRLEGEVALMGSIGMQLYEEARADGLRDGRAEGRAAGKAEGRAEGRAAATSAAVASLMRAMSWDVERAMDVLSVPDDERAACRERVAAGT